MYLIEEKAISSFDFTKKKELYFSITPHTALILLRCVVFATGGLRFSSHTMRDIYKNIV